MEIIDRIVDFNKYCDMCKYAKTKETDEPCCECLASPTNVHTSKPIKWVDGGRKKTDVEEDEEES